MVRKIWKKRHGTYNYCYLVQGWRLSCFHFKFKVLALFQKMRKVLKRMKKQFSDIFVLKSFRFKFIGLTKFFWKKNVNVYFSALNLLIFFAYVSDDSKIFFPSPKIEKKLGIIFSIFFSLRIFWNVYKNVVLCYDLENKIENKIDNNSKNNNQKINFSFVSEHCATIWANK